MTPIITAIAILLAVTAWSQVERHRSMKKLAALRRNCFVTNEKGHRVRYTAASREVQAQVER